METYQSTECAVASTRGSLIWMAMPCLTLTVLGIVAFAHLPKSFLPPAERHAMQMLTSYMAFYP